MKPSDLQVAVGLWATLGGAHPLSALIRHNMRLAATLSENLSLMNTTLVHRPWQDVMRDRDIYGLLFPQEAEFGAEATEPDTPVVERQDTSPEEPTTEVSNKDTPPSPFDEPVTPKAAEDHVARPRHSAKFTRADLVLGNVLEAAEAIQAAQRQAREQLAAAQTQARKTLHAHQQARVEQLMAERGGRALSPDAKHEEDERRIKPELQTLENAMKTDQAALSEAQVAARGRLAQAQRQLLTRRLRRELGQKEKRALEGWHKRALKSWLARYSLELDAYAMPFAIYEPKPNPFEWSEKNVRAQREPGLGRGRGQGRVRKSRFVRV